MTEDSFDKEERGREREEQAAARVEGGWRRKWQRAAVLLVCLVWFGLEIVPCRLLYDAFLHLPLQTSVKCQFSFLEFLILFCV